MKKMISSRRGFLKTSTLSGLAIALRSPVWAALGSGKDSASPSLPVIPSFPQMEWQECEMGLIFHFDISVATRNFRGDNQVKEIFDPKKYNPAKLDTDQWVQTARDAGASYAIFTATHFGGFLQWQSDLYPYGLKQAAWQGGKGDIVGDFIKSCYKYNIRPGLYLSTHRNAYWSVDKHFVDWGDGKGTDRQMQYNQICEKMTEELCSRYGRLLQIWFDAGVMTPEQGGPDVVTIFEKYQPNGIFYHGADRSDCRWIGNENGLASYPCWATMSPGRNFHNYDAIGSGMRDGTLWSPAMVDVPLRGAQGIHRWFWIPDEETGIYSLEKLLTIHDQSVGRNSNLIIGTVINSDGLVPDADARRLAELGNAIREQYSHKLGTTNGSSTIHEINLSKPFVINRYVIQEDIRYGERIESFIIRGQLENGIWITIDKGTSVGHKRIGLWQQDGKFTDVALHIVQSRSTPMIREFSVY